MASIQPRHFVHLTSAVSFSKPGLSGKPSLSRFLSKPHWSGLSINCGPWDMAIQPTKFAIVLVSGFESRVAVSRLGLSPEHGTRNTRLETVFLPASSLHVRDMRRFDVQL